MSNEGKQAAIPAPAMGEELPPLPWGNDMAIWLEVRSDSEVAEEFKAYGRACMALRQPVANNLPIELELPSGDTRTARVAYQEVRDGKRWVCITVSQPAPSPKRQP